jgi:rhodanese-related sulfurtransferase
MSEDKAYAGDIEVQDVWKRLSEEPTAMLVDVRTRAEWSFVGAPDLTTVGKQVLFVSWQVFPEMNINADFAKQVSATAPEKDTPLFFMCRSGVRSKASASAMTDMGYTNCYNVTSGFEGDHDDDQHRGGRNGWKMGGLPWVQG